MWGQATYKTWLTWENANLRMQLTVDDGMGFLSSPFEDAINTSIQKQRVASARHGYEDDGSGVDVLWPNFVNLCATLSSVCVIAGLTLMITWWSPIVVLLFTGLSGVVLVRFNERQEKLKASLDESNFVQKYLYQEAFKLGAGKDIRLYHLQDQYRKKIDETYNCVIETQKKMNWQKVKSISIICLLDCFQLLLVYLPLVSRASANDMSLPTFAFLFTLLGTLSALTRKGATEFSQLMLANEDVSVGRVYLDYVDGLELQAAEGRKKISVGSVTEIAFRHVSYHYPNSKEQIIRDVSFTIKENESIALVGLNGAGKSTLVSLLMGLLKPTNGEILINGIPSSAFDSQVYMRLFSPIFQFGATFADTIENNITLTNTSDLSVDSAIDQARLTKDIQALPEGKHTSLTQYLDDKGVSLSGGQSQKLMLARALYKNGQVLVLDEPTAALDALAESDLYQQYHELTRGKIAIFISHRLASTQFADTVFFIKDGRLVDTGTHSELMQMNEEYANLYNVQSQYYQEEDDSND